LLFDNPFTCPHNVIVTSNAYSVHSKSVTCRLMFIIFDFLDITVI
jgi:hypothetical protein